MKTCPKCHTQQFYGDCAHCATKAELAYRKLQHTPTPDERFLRDTLEEAQFSQKRISDIVHAVNAFDKNEKELAFLRNCHEELLKVAKQFKTTMSLNHDGEDYYEYVSKLIAKAEGL